MKRSVRTTGMKRKTTSKVTINISKETEVVRSKCCECGYECDRVPGPRPPGPGDWSLCIKCGSLNVFDDNMNLRRPTDSEVIESAGVSKLQELRRGILALRKKGER